MPRGEGDPAHGLLRVGGTGRGPAPGRVASRCGWRGRPSGGRSRLPASPGAGHRLAACHRPECRATPVLHGHCGRARGTPGKTRPRERLWPLVLHLLLSGVQVEHPRPPGRAASESPSCLRGCFSRRCGGPDCGCLSPEPGSCTGRGSGGRDPASGTPWGLGRHPCLHLGVWGEQAGAETAEERCPARLPPEAGRTPGAHARALIVARPCIPALSPARHCTGH